MTSPSRGQSSCEVPQTFERFGRLGANRVVGVNVSRANDALLIDDVPRRHGQPVSRLVVEPVQRASKRFVKLAKIVGQCEHKLKQRSSSGVITTSPAPSALTSE